MNMAADRPADAVVAGVDLRLANPRQDPDAWRTYQRGMCEVYSGIGAGEVALGPEVPAGGTAIVLAVTDGGVVGGILLRDRTGIAEQSGSPHLAAAIAERFSEGVNEIGGCWIRASHQGTGIATALAAAALRAAAGRVRWTVTLANQFSLGVGLRVGFVPDERFRDLPFPDHRFRSTLCWFDHRGDRR